MREYARLEWCTNKPLQVQRLAHEKMGIEMQSHAVDVVPLTEKRERLAAAVLDLRDMKHSMLMRALTPAESDVKKDAIVAEVEMSSDGPSDGGRRFSFIKPRVR